MSSDPSGRKGYRRIAPSSVRVRLHIRHHKLIERLEVSVTFDERRGYVATAPELRQPVLALSLGGVRRRIEALLLPEEPIVVLNLDRAARLERDRRRAAAGNGRALPR
jgi:hypothetical protein